MIPDSDYDSDPDSDYDSDPDSDSGIKGSPGHIEVS
jgi:hypothetical protein